MSNTALNWAFMLPIAGIKKPVLVALANHADDDGGSCFPSIATIALYAGLSARSVTKALRQLESDRLISTNASTDGRSSSRYRLLMKTGTPAQCAPPGVNNVHPTPAQCAPPGVNNVHPNLQRESIIESIKESQTPPTPSFDLSADTERRKPVDKGLFGSLDLCNTPAPRNRSAAVAVSETVTMQGFDEFWALLPTGKRVDKSECQKQFRIAVTKNRVPIETITDGMRRYASQFAPSGQKDPQYAVNPAKWLKGQRWTDEPSAQVNHRPLGTLVFASGGTNGGGMMGALFRSGLGVTL